MSYFPLFIDLERKKILVVGGGRIAARRVKALLDFGAELTVVSPELCAELKTLEEDRRIRWIPEEYREAFLTGACFVLAAATEPVNLQAVQDCRKADIPVNDASHKENCDFYFPGLIKEGETVVGVTAGGRDHRQAAALTAALRKFIRETWKA